MKSYEAEQLQAIGHPGHNCGACANCRKTMDMAADLRIGASVVRSRSYARKTNPIFNDRWTWSTWVKLVNLWTPIVGYKRGLDNFS